MTQITYEAAVYTRTVHYKNFKGDERKAELFFALDPLQLMEVIASFEPKKQKRSGNPAKQNQDAEISDEQQFKFVRDLCVKAAGFPSDDGESWEPFEEFADSIAGKAFLTKLASSDDDRREFAQTVILDPFRAFVKYAEVDPSNTEKDMKQLHNMLQMLENVFVDAIDPKESFEERRARLAAELAELDKGQKPDES